MWRGPDISDWSRWFMVKAGWECWLWRRNKAWPDKVGRRACRQGHLVSKSPTVETSLVPARERVMQEKVNMHGHAPSRRMFRATLRSWNSKTERPEWPSSSSSGSPSRNNNNNNNNNNRLLIKTALHHYWLSSCSASDTLLHALYAHQLI